MPALLGLHSLIAYLTLCRSAVAEVGNHGANTNSAFLTATLHKQDRDHRFCGLVECWWDAPVSGCTFMITLNEADHLDGSRLNMHSALANFLSPTGPRASEHLESKGFNQIIGRVVRGMEAGISASRQASLL